MAGPTHQAFYQYVENKYHFGLSGNNKSSNNSINIALRDVVIEENIAYSLDVPESGSNYGETDYKSIFFKPQIFISGKSPLPISMI